MLSLWLAMLVAQPVAPLPGAEAAASNVRLAVSGDLACLLGRRHVDRCERICEEILGIQVRGITRSVGEINLEFVPSAQGAVVDLVLTAVSRPLGHLIGKKGPVTLITDGESFVSGRKRIVLFPEGVSTLPAIADVQPTAKLVRIDTPYQGVLDRWLRNAALQSNEKNRAEATAIVRERAIVRTRHQLDEDVAVQLPGWNHQLKELFWEPLQRRGIDPRSFHFWTDAGHLHIAALLTGPMQTVMIGPPPELPPGTHLGFWLHQSLPGGQLTQFLAGKERSSEQLAKRLREALGATATTREGEPGQESLTIRFPDAEPVTLTFADGEVTATIRTESFAAGDTIYDSPLSRLKVKVRYRLGLEANRLVAQRVGAVEVLPAKFKEGDRISARQLSVIGELERRLGELFLEKALDITTALPVPPAVAGRIGALRLEHLVISGGWLAVGVRALPPVIQVPVVEPCHPVVTGGEKR